MKKRILSVIFAAFMLSACAFGFAACGEQTTIGAPQDNETEQGDNEDVTQGSEADDTQGGTENDPQGGGEPTVRTTVTEEEWNAAFGMDGVRNVTVTMQITDSSEDNYYYIFYIDDHKWYWDAARKDQGEEDWDRREWYYEILEIVDYDSEMFDESAIDMDEYFMSAYKLVGYYEVGDIGSGIWGLDGPEEIGWDLIPQNSYIVAQLGIMRVPFSNFSYNENKRQYEAEDVVLTLSNGLNQSVCFGNVSARFENGKLINYEAQYYAESYPENIQSVKLSFTDYGTTSVTLPEVSVE